MSRLKPSARVEIDNWPRYRCRPCGADFDEAEARTDASGRTCCPDCGSTDLTDHGEVDNA